MLSVEPSERYTAENVFTHPFLTCQSQFNMPLSAMDAMKAFQNQEKLMNVGFYENY